MCHGGILWEGDTLPLAAAAQMLHGKTLYSGIWYDKPPLVALFPLLAGGRDGWLLRIEDAVYAWVACVFAYLLARDLWSKREGRFAAGWLAFFLIFDFPATAIPAASDELLLAPHLAAVWLTARRRPFWSGVAVGMGFWASPKALMALAVCALWDFAGAGRLLAGFAAALTAGAAALAAFGALGAFWNEVWVWGRVYAGNTFVAHPLWNGLTRTLDWAGFHAAIVAAATWFLAKSAGRWRWMAWAVLALAGVAAGMRFFPRYYFLLLPVAAVMAARGVMQMGQWRFAALALLLIPAIRFAPAYVVAARELPQRDTAMDRDSRAASGLVRNLAKPGDTLFVWGYRPEDFVYTGLPAATIYLDSQPLSGVPADRHLTQSEPVETAGPERRRAGLAESRPTFLLDGIGVYNPRLAIGQYPDLRDWFSHYREIGRTEGTVVYKRAD